MTLRNRIVMGSMHTGLEDRIWDVPKLAAYYAERAKGGAGLIVTGGIAPTRTGLLLPFANSMTNHVDVLRHRQLTSAVHKHDGRIAMQILHAGRYGYTPLKFGPTWQKSPIHPFQTIRMPDAVVKATIWSFGHAAKLAKRAGYDAVEIMGGEGYLINQFLCEHSNGRTDAWGGSPEKRQRFAVEVLRAVRKAVGDEYPVIFRQSIADFVPDGQTWEDIVLLAKSFEQEGVTAINTDIGWHEAQVPTIVTSVPRGAFVRYTEALADEVGVPVIASNRINTPEAAEEILTRGKIDLVSMARPLLADPDFANKAAAGRADEINTCIACNQACLDHAFVGKKVSCLLNPRAGRETTLVLGPTRRRRSVAVVGAGPTGLAAATNLAERGHAVTLFEAADDVGGQFAIAARIPGKEEFAETLRYFRRRLEVTGVDVRLGVRITAEDLVSGGYDDVVLATGVIPRMPDIAGIDDARVVTYADAVLGRKPVGDRVAVIGAGGIGFDVTEFLTTPSSPTLDLPAWEAEWGVTRDGRVPGFLVKPHVEPSARTVYLLQRKTSRQGRGLGKTSGWVHRATVKAKGVEQLSGVRYDRIDADGLHISFDDEVGAPPRVLDVDTIVLCAGQESVRDLLDELTVAGVTTHVIGGADVAAELDAKRAIRQATELAAAI